MKILTVVCLLVTIVNSQSFSPNSWDHQYEDNRDILDEDQLAEWTSSPRPPLLSQRNSRGKGWIGQQQHHQPVSSSSFQQRTSSTSLVTTSSSDNNQRLTNLLLTKQMVEPPSRPHSFWDEPLYKPQFDESLPRNITAQLGRTVHLPCRIRQLADRTISWVRQRDLHILTVGRYTYTSDQRFSCLHVDGTDDWTLEIKYLRREDAGVYECQASTEPKMSFSTRLNVVAAKAKIPEGDVWAKAGSTVTLNCLISESSSPPSYVFWYHEGTVINYSDHSSKSRGGGKVKIVTDKLTGTSRLEIIGIRAPDSGKYTCKASHADPTSVTLHVIPLHESNHQQAIHDRPDVILDANVNPSMTSESSESLPSSSSSTTSSSPVILSLSALLSLTFFLLTLMFNEILIPDLSVSLCLPCS